MDALSGQNLTFHTLPITGNENVPGIGDVNTVDVPAIQAQVAAAFSQPPGGSTSSSGQPGKGTSSSSSAKAPAKSAAPVPPASGVTVDVYNGGAAGGSAGAVSNALKAKGYVPGAVTDAASTQSLTTVSYGAGTSANAALIAKDLGVTPTPGSSVPAGHVQVILGASYTGLPAALGGSSGTGSPGTASPSPTPTSTTPTYTTTNGSAVTVKTNAKYGIPCVY
jgi:hypothetical protein